MLFNRNFIPPKNVSYFLFGPRGTGKTTWLKHIYKQALWINLLNTKEERLFSMYPEQLKDRVEANPDKKIVVIDEVQKVPKILDIVHELIEEKKIQFVLTGSSARKLRRGGVNLLGGRALWKNFYPFIGSELGKAFDLSKALKTGMIPLIYNSENPEENLQAYIELYLREEVKEEALVRQLGNFSRFLEAMAFSHGSIVNFSNISRDCMVARKTVENYSQILKDLLLGYTLDVFEKRAKRMVSSHPKFYFFDPGVFRCLMKQNFLNIATEVEGPALEGLVVEHLRNFANSQKEKPEIYFWRTRSGLEVDFVLYGLNDFYAIEVKNNKTFGPKDLRGLKEFKKEYPEVFPVLLYRGKERIKRDGIFIFPVEEFLKKLDPLVPFTKVFD